MENKINNNEKVTEQKEDLTNFEKIQFMQFEYDWQKKRLDDLYNKSNLLLCWNAAVFVFAITVTDVDKIVNAFKNYYSSPVTTAIVVALVFVFLSLVLIVISTLGFFNCSYMKKLMCFQIQDNIDHNFDITEITDDYRKIIVYYDELMIELTQKIKINIILMLIGVSLLLIFEYVLKILVSIV